MDDYMFSSKKVNQGVIDMYNDEKTPYIETVITIRSPMEKDGDLHQKFSTFMGNIAPTLEGLNNNISEIIGETFESDVVSIYSKVKNL